MIAIELENYYTYTSNTVELLTAISLGIIKAIPIKIKLQNCTVN